MELSAINWLSVLVAAFAFSILRVLWYGPLFGSQWLQTLPAEGQGAGSIGKNQSFASALIMAFIVSAGLSMLFHLIDVSNDFTALKGGLYGLIIGVFFVLPAIAINYIHAQRTLTLILIDGFYHLVGFTLAGTIVSAW